MTLVLDTFAVQNGTLAVEVAFTDENGHAIVPNEGLTWTLTDLSGAVVNNRQNVYVSPGATTTIVLSGNDLALQGNYSAERLLTITGTYNGSAGNGYPLYEQCQFTVTRLTTAASVTDETNEDAYMINVTDYASPQAAIDAASLMNGGRGVPVYFPAGTYTLTEPLILPRTDASPLHSVHLIGDGRWATTLTAGLDFPANRALVEWEYVAKRAWEQRIAKMGFSLPSVAGVMAIHYKITDNTSQSAVNLERLQLDLEDIYIGSHNDYHEVAIKIEGICNYSSFKRIFGDPARGSATYDTLLLQTDVDFNGVDPGDGDSPGLFMCDLSQLHGMIRRGGYSVIFEGRLCHSTMSDCFSNGGKNKPDYYFKNSYTGVLNNLATEGQGEKPQYKFDTCYFMSGRNIGIGSPNAIGDSGVGNGLELINCEDCSFDNHYSGYSKPAFSWSGVKVITTDANSKRNIFTQWGVKPGGAVSNEFTLNGTENVVHYVDVYNDTSGTLP